MVGTACLDHYLPRFVPSPGTSAYLCDQLKRSFIRTKVREMNHAVRVENANKAHVVKVQAFSNHLRSYKNIGFTTFELLDDRFITGLRSRRIKVHSLHSSFRKIKVEFF